MLLIVDFEVEPTCIEPEKGLVKPMLDAELMFICLWLLAVTQMVLLYEANARLLFLSPGVSLPALRH